MIEKHFQTRTHWMNVLVIEHNLQIVGVPYRKETLENKIVLSFLDTPMPSELPKSTGSNPKSTGSNGSSEITGSSGTGKGIHVYLTISDSDQVELRLNLFHVRPEYVWEVLRPLLMSLHTGTSQEVFMMEHSGVEEHSGMKRAAEENGAEK